MALRRTLGSAGSLRYVNRCQDGRRRDKAAVAAAVLERWDPGGGRHGKIRSRDSRDSRGSRYRQLSTLSRLLIART